MEDVSPSAPAGFEDAPKQPAAPAGFDDVAKPQPDNNSNELNPFAPPLANNEANSAVSTKVFQQTQPGRLMAVANQAFKIDEPLGLSPETEQKMREWGIYGSQEHSNFLTNFNEAIIRPSAIIGDAALRTVNAAMVGTVGVAGAMLNTHEDAETNARHAQQFVDDMMVASAFTPEGAVASASIKAGEIPKPPMPPSAERSIVATPKPWQADIPAVDVAATEAPKPVASQPPITNLPVPGTPEAKAAGENGGSGAPPSTTAPVGKTNPILDGSGNLNLDYIRADQSTKDIMAQTSQAYAEKYGVSIPHVQTVQEANLYFDEALKQTTNGIPDVLASYQRNDPVNPDLLWTARQAAVQLGVSFRKLSDIANSTKDPEDISKAGEAFDRMVQVVGPIRHEATATAGRTLNSLKIPVGDEATGLTDEVVQKLAGMSADDAMRIVSTLDTPQAIAKFVTDIQKPSFADMGMYYVFNNYLSGPLTHSAYAASWAIETVLRATLDTPIASAIGKIQDWAGKTLEPAEVTAMQTERQTLMDKITAADRRGSNQPLTAVESAQTETRLKEINTRLKNATTVMPHESAARLYGIGEGALDSIRAGGRALKTGNVGMLPGEMAKAEKAGKVAEAAALEAGKTAEQAKQAGLAAYQDNAMNFGNPIVQRGEMIKNPVGSAVVKGIGQVVGVPMRVIAALHTGMKFSGYAESLNALAYRQAATEGLAGGRAAIMDDSTALGARIAAIKNNPTPEMMKQAADESKNAALMGKSGAFGQKFQGVANVNAWTRTIVPFSKVVTNLTAQKLLEKTPLGILSPVNRGKLLGAEGNAEQATAIAKMLRGSTLLTGGAYLAAQGASHGWGSDDANERAFNKLQGNNPYSVNIGNLNLPHRFFGVNGGSLSLGADIHDISQWMNDNDKTYKDWLDVMGQSVHYIGRDILSENALSGPAELYDAINNREGAAKFYVPNAIASALAPYSSFQSQINGRFIDPIMRQTMGEDSYSKMKETIQARTIEASKSLMPQIDIFGRPLLHNEDHTAAINDPVFQALDHLSIFPSKLQPKLFGVSLDEKQYADYQTIAGRSLYTQLQSQVTNPNWVRLSDQEQANVIQAAIKVSRAQARGTMSLLYPQVVKDSGQQKRDLLQQYDDTP